MKFELGRKGARNFVGFSKFSSEITYYFVV